MRTSHLRSTVLAALLATAGAAASAATLTNVPAGPTADLPFASFGNAANPSGDSPAVGELFSVNSASTLSSFTLYALGNETHAFQLNLAEWNPTTYAVGTVLSTGSVVETYNSGGKITALQFDDLAWSLKSGVQYIAYLTSGDARVSGVQLSRTQTANDVSGFGAGNAYLSTIPGNGWQRPFNGFLSLQYSANVSAVPEPASLALMLAGFGLLALRGRRGRAA